MPTYEYRCDACGHEFETMHGMTAPVLRKCPKCGKLKLVRLISGGAGVIFKGSGFYETDYKQQRRGSDSGKGDSKESRKSDDSKELRESRESKETKPDAKTDKPAESSKPQAKGEGRSEPKSEPKPKKDSGSKRD